MELEAAGRGAPRQAGQQIIKEEVLMRTLYSFQSTKSSTPPPFRAGMNSCVVYMMLEDLYGQISFQIENFDPVREPR